MSTKRESPILLRRRELAALLGVAESTIDYWRREDILPEPFPLGKNSLVWRRETIDEWLADRERGAA